jgi:hypothetical protein
LRSSAEESSSLSSSQKRKNVLGFGYLNQAAKVIHRLGYGNSQKPILKLKIILKA